MAIRKQIGWSQEANLMHNISLQLDRLIKVRANGTVSTTTTSAPPFLTLVFIDPAYVPFYVNDADPTDVASWNTVFDLPANGTPFTSVSVNGTTVVLGNTGNIIFAKYNGTDGVLEMDDPSGIITRLSYYSLGQTGTLTNLNLQGVITIDDEAVPGGNDIITSINFPKVETIGGFNFNSWTKLENIYLPELIRFTSGGADQTFTVCPKLTDIYIPSCIELGLSCGTDGIFLGCPVNVNITINSAIANCGGPGLFDGDILAMPSPNITIV
jgi:hypothetical protein